MSFIRWVGNLYSTSGGVSVAYAAAMATSFDVEDELRWFSGSRAIQLKQVS